MLIFLVAVVTAALGMADWPVIKQKHMRRERVVTIIFWLGGLTAACFAIYKVKAPSLLLVLKVVYEPVNKLFGVWFH